MEDYMKEIENRVIRSGLLSSWGLPQGLKDLIRTELEHDRLPNFRVCYVNIRQLSPEARKEVEGLLKIWDSPLVKALS